MCRGKTILYSPGIKSIRNSVLSSQLFLREGSKERQAVWPFEFIHAPTLLGFSCRSLGFCRGTRKLHLMIQYFDCMSEEH